MDKVLNKSEIYRRMDRFQEDDNTPWSWPMLAELAGYASGHMRDVFVYKTHTMTETMQIRVSHALAKIERGDVTVMRNRDQTRFIQYNQKPQPRMARGNRIILENGAFKVKPGIINRNDYSHITLKEQLEG